MRNTFYQSKEKYGFKKLKWWNERYFVPKTFFQTALYRFLFMNMGWGGRVCRFGNEMAGQGFLMP